MKKIDFGTLYIKPAFIFQDGDGAVKLQFEADANSALGYLYDNLCKMLGLAWGYDSPYNKLGAYTNCAMHAAGDRAQYGCGPDNTNAGGFCPQMTIGYRVGFQSEDAAAAFMDRGNNYVNYWRKMYPSGVAVGTKNFCPKGGCLGLFLNRYDLYQVFKPGLGGSWVSYNGATFAPTTSPAPTAKGGCNNSHNRHLDKCLRRRSRSRRAPSAAWQSLGKFGQLSVFLVSFMAISLSLSMFLARARKKRKRGETYMAFLVRDVSKTMKKELSKSRMRKKKLHKKRRTKNKDLEADMLDGDRPRSKSRPKSSRSKSRVSSRSSSRRPDDASKKSSSKHRSSSSRPRSDHDNERHSVKSRDSSRHNNDDGEHKEKRRHRERSRDRERSGDEDRSHHSRSRSKSRSGRSRSRSRSRRERDSLPDIEQKDLSRRQLV